MRYSLSRTLSGEAAVFPSRRISPPRSPYFAIVWVAALVALGVSAACAGGTRVTIGSANLEIRRARSLVQNGRWDFTGRTPVFDLLQGGQIDLSKRPTDRRFALDGGDILEIRSWKPTLVEYSIRTPVPLGLHVIGVPADTRLLAASDDFRHPDPDRIRELAKLARGRTRELPTFIPARWSADGTLEATLPALAVERLTVVVYPRELDGEDPDLGADFSRGAAPVLFADARGGSVPESKDRSKPLVLCAVVNLKTGIIEYTSPSR